MVKQLMIAKTAEEAVSLKGQRSAFLAGGTEINRLGTSCDASRLIGIGRVPTLDGIDEYMDAEKGTNYIRIGAMSTFQDIIESPLVPAYLKEACFFMGSRTKRNMATIGGNIALRRTDSYLYATLLACHAKLDLMCKDGAVIRKCTRAYLEDYKTYSDMLIVSILVPVDAVVASKRYANTVQSHAVLTVSAGLTEGKLRVAVAAKDTYLGMLPEGELPFKDDIFGSAEYKKYLLSVTVEDLVKKVTGGAV